MTNKNNTLAIANFNSALTCLDTGCNYLNEAAQYEPAFPTISGTYEYLVNFTNNFYKTVFLAGNILPHCEQKFYTFFNTTHSDFTNYATKYFQPKEQAFYNYFNNEKDTFAGNYAKCNDVVTLGESVIEKYIDNN